MKTGRPARVSHITFAQALARMLAGPVTASDVIDVTGLHRTTVYKLLRSLERAGAVYVCGKQKDSMGRMSVDLFALSKKI